MSMNKISWTLATLFFLVSANAQNILSLQDYENSKLQSEKIVSDKKSNILTIQSQIAKLEKILNERKQNLDKKIRLLQQLNRQGIGSFLALKNVTEFEQNLRTLRLLSENEMSVIREYIYLRQDLEKQQKNLKHNVIFLSQKLNEIKTVEIKISQSEKIELERLENNNLPSLLREKGKLIRPVSAKLKVHYGNHRLRDARVYLHNPGVIFRSTKGEEVHSVSLGKVIFSDVLPYWDKVIIIEHDGGYFSVYAHVLNEIVSLNQTVSAGQKIAETSQHDFYFELRHHRTAINPQGWIKDF